MALPTFRQGRILWARLRARGGKKELHPAIIITAERDIIQPERFDPRKDIDKVNAVAVVGVSTSFAKYPPFVLLPYSSSPGGHPVTKLREACGACIGWYDWVVLEDDVEGYGGDAPPAELDQIMDGITKDLATKLKAKVSALNRELAELHEMLATLIGQP
jgi:hypothetical protein